MWVKAWTLGFTKWPLCCAVLRAHGRSTATLVPYLLLASARKELCRPQCRLLWKQRCTLRTGRRVEGFMEEVTSGLELRNEEEFA